MEQEAARASAVVGRYHKASDKRATQTARPTQVNGDSIHSVFRQVFAEASRPRAAPAVQR